MSAFDALAPTYDADFTLSPIARALRERVHARLLKSFGEGDRVLELGCGTGEDALFLARHGVSVIATDSSAAMLDAARRKTASSPLITVQPLDFAHLPDSFAAAQSFNGVFANFGVLNCLADWKPLAAWLARRVVPGGRAAFGVMSPFCAWEIGWHAAHLDFRVALRRLHKSATFQPGNAAPIPIHYPTIRRLTRDFAPHFARIHVQPLGLVLPTSDSYAVVERCPALLKRLLKADETLSAIAPLSLFADHYWIEFQRQS